MSGIQIPGLNTLFPAPTNGSVADDQVAKEDTQTTIIASTDSHPKTLEGPEDEMIVDRPTSPPKPTSGLETAAAENTSPVPISPENLGNATTESHTTSIGSDNLQSTNFKAIEENMVIDHPPSPPSLTSGLEALLGGLDPLPEAISAPIALDPGATSENNSTIDVGRPLGGDDGAADEENPEWEADSSPYESSSDSSSSDDSDDADSDDEKDYKILGPEETARILMEMDGGSDDEADGKGKGGGSGLVRTKNEQPETFVPRPEVEIKPEMEITELGTIEHFVENMVVIKAKITGEYQVLDTGSVLCREDRTVIAAVTDVIAAVREPRYTAGFTNEEEITAFGLEIGTKIFYPPALAVFGLTQALKANKGTDASNWHDEEVAEDEIEFSDDEKEAEYKRQQKAKKRGARGGRDDAASRGGRNNAPHAGASAAIDGLKYDDDEVDDEGPYRPLSRPVGFGQGQPPSGGNEASGSHAGRGNANRGNRGDFRGRGNRGRGGRGSRGGNPRGGYSLPPRPQSHSEQGVQGSQQQPTQQYNPPSVPFIPGSGQSYPAFTPPQTNVQQPHQPPMQQFTFSWPQNSQPGFFPPPPPPPSQFTGQGQAGVNGMYLNPNFLAALQSHVQNQQNQQHNQQQSQQHNQQQNNQWTGQHGQPHGQWPGQGGHG